MEHKWSVFAVISFIIGAVCFFKIMYLDILFAILSIVLAVKGFLVEDKRYLYLVIIGASAFLLVLASFQLLIRTRELGYLPPLF